MMGGRHRNPGSRHRKLAPPKGEATTASFRLAYGRQDGKIRVWDLHKRSNINIPEPADAPRHVTNVQGLDYSAAQNTMVSTGRDRTNHLVEREDLETADDILSGTLGGRRLSRRRPPDLCCGANGYVRVWETDTGRELTKEQPAKAEGEAIVSAVYCSAASLVLCAQADHTLALYTIPTNVISGQAPLELAPFRPTKRISGTHDDILDLAYALPDKSLLALATNSEDVRLVSVAETQGEPDGGEGAGYFGQDVALLQGHSEIVMCLDVD